MFYCLFSPICICHPRGPLFDLSPPAPASPGSRWPVDWQLWSDIWWDEASTGAPRRQKQTCGVTPHPYPAPEQRCLERGLVQPLDDARCKRMPAPLRPFHVHECDKVCFSANRPFQLLLFIIRYASCCGIVLFFLTLVCLYFKIVSFSPNVINY